MSHTTIERELSDADAIALLKTSYGLTDTTIAHFQIKPNSQQRAWEYPVRGGTRYKKYSRGKPKKYWHTEGTPNQLYRLEDIPDRTDVIYWVNGEPARWLCWQLGISAICVLFGEGKIPENAVDQLLAKGVKEIRLVGDLDKAGETGARNIVLNLQKHFTMKNLQLPAYLGNKADVCDLFLFNKAGFKSVLESLPEVAEKVLPEVITTNRQLNDVVNEILDILYRENANNPTIFNGISGLVQITTNKDGLPILVELTPDALRVMLSDRALFFTVREKGGKTAINPQQIYVDSILAIKRDFPPINGITEIPVVRKDGTVLMVKGYDAETRLYYSPTDCIIPDIPELPTQEDVTKAADLIKEVICDFPFNDEASRANTVAAVIAPFIEPMIADCRPLTLFDKPQQGTGATLLASVVSWISTGCSSEPITPPTKEEEWKKVIISCLIEGQKVGLIDNVAGTIASSSLASMLTAERVKDRILGKNKTVSAENHCSWLVTGNNIRLGSDLPRRCVLVRLDAHMAEPWLGRTFKHYELKEWVMDNRGRIIGAILILIRAWQQAGKPVDKDVLVLGGFEKYCKVISGILKIGGIGGFLGNTLQMYAEMDTDATEWASFIKAWHDIIGEREITVKELEAELTANEELRSVLPSDIADMNQKNAKGQNNYTRILARSLRDQKERTFANGLVLVKADTVSTTGAVRWVVLTQEFVSQQNRHQQTQTDSDSIPRRDQKNNSQYLKRPQTESFSVSPDTKPLTQDICKSVTAETTTILPMGTPCKSCGEEFNWYAKDGVIICGKCQTPEVAG
jgi:hypothetical protein